MTNKADNAIERNTAEILQHRFDRRTLIRRGAALGLGLPVVSTLLAACGGDDEEPETDDSESEVDDATDEPDIEIVEDEPDPTPEPEDEPEEETPEEEPEVEEQELEPSPDLGEGVAPQSDAMAYGFNIAWRPDGEGGQFNADTQNAVRSAGFNWMRFQIHWSEIQREPDWYDPAPVDQMIDLYDGSGIRVLVSVVGAPDWARDPEGQQLLSNFEQFGAFMQFLSDRYRGRVHAWEIWNEQNMAHEMHGDVRVSDYAYLLEAGFQGVRSGDPEALVVFGGLTPTGINDPAVAVNDVDYLNEFYGFEGGFYREFFDVLGVHLNATNNPPDTSYPDNPGPGEWTNDNSFYFLRGRDLRNVMGEHGDERPMWVTEFGWTTENPAPGYEYGADVSEEDQANFLVGAFNVAREQMPWINGMFVWNLNFSTLVPQEDEKYAWSVLNNDWSPRPAYVALQGMEKP